MTEQSTPDNVQALTDEIERTREQLGETVERLAAKADVQAVAREKATEVTARVTDGATRVKRQVATRAERAWGELTGNTAQVKDQAATRARQAWGEFSSDTVRARRAYIAVAAGALLAGWLIARGRRT
jgi:ABC-type transporter Mla subunit MlaD